MGFSRADVFDDAICLYAKTTHSDYLRLGGQMSVSANDRFERGKLGAMLRAAHLVEDQQPWIFDDEVAGKLSGFETDSSLTAALASWQGRLALRYPAESVQSLMMEMRAAAILRSRYAEDQLAFAVERGIAQYVILGSRFDSFVYRDRQFESTLRVFEVDHAIALQRKQKRLRELHLTPFSKVSHVPFGFDGRSLWGALKDAGFNQEEPAFFSWLGAGLYVPNDVIVQTLSQIAHAAVGSEVVFDYPVDEVGLDDEQLRMMAAIKSVMAVPGETTKNGTWHAEPIAQVKEMGYGEVSVLTATEANTYYFENRADELRFPQLTQIIKARVRESAPRTM